MPIPASSVASIGICISSSSDISISAIPELAGRAQTFEIVKSPNSNPASSSSISISCTTTDTATDSPDSSKSSISITSATIISSVNFMSIICLPAGRNSTVSPAGITKASTASIRAISFSITVSCNSAISATSV